MATAVAVILSLTPQAVEALMQLTGCLLERTDPNKQIHFRDNLSIVKVDLGLVKDVLTVINSRDHNDGIRAWKEEASRLVEEAQKLLTRIDRKNHRPTQFLLFRNKQELRYSSRDDLQLESLKTRLDNISKHHQTVLALHRDLRESQSPLHIVHVLYAVGIVTVITAIRMLAKQRV